MRKLLPFALTIGLSAVGLAQDSNTRMMNGKMIQEDKHTINVITPAPGESSVTTYSTSPSSSTYVASYTDSSMNNGDVKVRTDRHGAVVQTDRTTINKIKPAPSRYAMLSNGYVMSEPSSDVRVTTDKHGNVIQTDKTTINKITPAPASQTTTVTTTDSTTTVTTSNTNDFQD